VAVGDLLAKVDDKRATLQEKAAQYELQVAKAKAENDTAIKFARASAEVAATQWRAAWEANRGGKEIVPQLEVLELKLTHTKTVSMIQQETVNQQIAKLEVNVSQATLDAATENLSRHKIVSPVAGVVDKNVLRYPGEWVKAGDPVMKIIRMDKLYVQGDVDISEYSPGALVNQTVRVQATLRQRVFEFPGKVVAVGSAVSGGKFATLRAEVDNEQDADGRWVLPSEYTVTMIITPKAMSYATREPGR
jgi:multidrug efflux pump subunit AcrA (membrane-fusion protein)